MISDYGKVHNTHRKEALNLVGGNVWVEEKVDGWQFGFGVYNGTLYCRSKSRNIALDNPHGDFGCALPHLQEVASLMPEGCQFRAEFLKGPRQNKITYGRAPKNHLVLFDATDSNGYIVDYETKVHWAKKLDLDVTPKLWEGQLESYEQLQEFMGTKSFLGKAEIEGVVVKNGTQCRAKVVSEAFRERKPSIDRQGELIAAIGACLSTEARWAKVVQDQELVGGPEDFQVLLPKLFKDLEAEEDDFIKEALYEKYKKKVLHAVAHNFKEWYLKQ